MMIVLAFFNGFLIVTTRAVNANLGKYVSGAGASFWNHLVGFLFLALILPMFSVGTSVEIGGISLYLFLGGVLGAGYVAVNNLVMPQLGATKATVLVIAGQIIIGTIIDVANGGVSNLSITVFGISLVLLGMWIGKRKKERYTKALQSYNNHLEAPAS